MAAARPDLAAILAPILARVAVAQRPLLIAVAERMAAGLVRGWASQVTDAAERAGLRACADREEEVARRVEALTPDAASLQRQILADNPGLEEVNRSLFAGRPLDEQLVVQASGERLGAATWRSFARSAPSAEVRETFLGCATLEEERAAYLESMIGSRARPETHVSGRSQTRA